MNKIEEKIKTLLSERETILDELSEIQKAYDMRQQRLIEIIGSIKTLQEVLNENQENDTNENEEENTTKN